MTAPRRFNAALAALAVILVITASWWALALWPDRGALPSWVVRTRLACFGNTPDGLPDAGGWVLLIGQPIGMLLVLFAVWGRSVREGLSRLSSDVAGQLAVGVVSALIFVGAAGALVRVREASAQPFDANPASVNASQFTRLHDAPPALDLVNQTGARITLARFAGRPVLVTFAYAHCQTVCPLVVHDVLLARDRLGEGAPAVLVITIDPTRDTPGRLPTMAKQWGVTGDAHVLSGEVDDVERVLTAWRLPRVRNEATGDYSHPAIVYVLGPDGRITYALPGGVDAIVAAVRAL